MFVGTLPAKELSPILVDTFRGCKRIGFPTSGNFTSEKVLKELMEVEVFSNDIAFYSICLGRLLSREPIQFSLVEEFAFLEEFMTTEAMKFSVVLFLMEVGQFQSASAHAARIRKHLLENHRTYIEDQASRVEASAEKITIDHFSSVDLFRFIAEAPADLPIACYPPTYKGGYEKLYRFVEDAVEYDRPEYTVFDPQSGVKELLGILEERDTPYLVCSDIDPEELEATPRHQIHRHKKKPIFFYTNLASHQHYYYLKNSVKEYHLPVFDSADPLTGEENLEVVQVDGSMVEYYKTIYLSKKITSAGSMFNFAVVLDGKLFGFLGYILSAQMADFEDLYLACDFVVTDTHRGSKLVAMLAKCRESVEIVKYRLLNDYKTISTTVFTDKPVSMKYRGIFKIRKKEPGKLMYHTELPDRLAPAKEIYQQWLKKYHLK